MKRVLLVFGLVWGFALTAVAHVGSPNVFFDGRAGAYSIYAVIRPPSALPGVAQVSVKVRDAEVHAVSLLPVLWQAGSEGSPQPVAARAVSGETNLWDGEVWMLRPGSYTIRISVEGPRGKGEAIVPVNVLGMPSQGMKSSLRIALLALAAVLLLSAVAIVQAVARESVLPPDAKLGGLDVARGRRAAVAAAALVVAGVAAGGIRWRKMDLDYRNFGSQKPEPVIAEIESQSDRVLLELSQAEQSLSLPSWANLVPDHGKLMHLFLVREPGLDVFAHLHPVRQDEHRFALELPALPSGGYQLYGDVTFENGIAQTLVAHVSLPEPKGNGQLIAAVVTNLSGEVFCGFTSPNSNTGALTRDMDDSWHVENGRLNASLLAKPMLSAGKTVSPLMGGYTLLFENAGEISAGRATSMKFAAFGPDGSEVPLQPYMGMLGHAAVRREDGSVFAHLHPMGSFSMASQEAFRRRDTLEANPPRPMMAVGSGAANQVAFPYQFPKAGQYRIWVQVRLAGRVLTGVYEIEIKGRA